MSNNEKETIIAQIRQEIINNIDKEASVSHDRFFKDDEVVKTHGLKTADVHKIAKAAFQQIKKYPKETIFELCEELWKSGYLDEAAIACNWSESLHTKYEPADFAVFERWLSNYVTNWAHCDALCNHTVGLFIMK